MPRVKVDYIVSFSSESPEAPANNLLANEAGRGRWLCARGEPSCSVLLQLPKAVQISSITVGAHLSALVEVLVGRSETPNDPFQVLVASSVFLSPIDSRRVTEGDTAADRVRSFNTEHLAADVRNKRWDRVRVVCSQPYNKHCKYGLSFIHIFSPEGDAPSATLSSEPTKKTMKDSTTKPTLRVYTSPQDSDDDDLKPGALFAQHLAKTQSQSQGSQDSTSSTDSQIRKATSQAIKNVFNTSTKIVRTPISKPKGSATHSDEGRSDRKREGLMYEDEDATPSDKIDRLVAAHKDQQAKEAEKEKAIKEKEKQKREKDRKEKEKTESDSFKQRKDQYKDESAHNQTPKEKHKDITDDRNKTPHSSKKERDRRDDRSRSPKTPHSSKKERDRRDDRSRSPHSSKRDRTLSNKQDKDDDRSNKKQTVAKDQDSGKTLYAGPMSDKPHELLRDVVFVMSGYENPRRAAVRDAALAMGAQFQRDWNSRCTHLICAFSNTPKLKTVRSSPDGDKAIVVTAEWIERQAERCRRLPWQWFATEKKYRVQRKRSASGEDPPGTSRRDSDAENVAGTSTQADRQAKEENEEKREKRYKTPDSECDTDDEIERVIRLNAQKRNRANSEDESACKKTKTDTDVANVSGGSDVAFVCDEKVQAEITLSDDDDATDKEDVIEDTPELSTIDQLPMFFEGCTFALHGVNKPILDEKLVRRYVKAYGGEVVEAIDDEDDMEVDYILCLSGNTEGVRAKGRRVRGDWLWKCHERRRLCSPGEFAL